MNEYELERIRAVIERARPAIVEAQRVAAEAAPIVAKVQRTLAMDQREIAGVLRARYTAARVQGRVQGNVVQGAAVKLAGVQRVAQSISDQFRQLCEAIATRFSPVVEAINATGRRMAEQLQAAFTAMGDRLRLAVRAIRPAVKLGVAAIIEFAHYLHEQLSIKRLTGRMRSDPSRDLAERARRPPLRARPPTTTPPSPSLPLHEHRHDDPLVRKRCARFYVVLAF